MPVTRGPRINARSALIMGFSGVMIALVLGLGVFWLSRSGGEVEIRLGDTDFNAGQAARIAAEISESGPILYSDVAGRSRDIIVSHLGSDPMTGWWAFAARPPGFPRFCFFRWNDTEDYFVLSAAAQDVVSQESDATSDSCAVVTMNAQGILSTGETIESFPVTVDKDDNIRVDINRSSVATPATLD